MEHKYAHQTLKWLFMDPHPTSRLTKHMDEMDGILA